VDEEVRVMADRLASAEEQRAADTVRRRYNRSARTYDLMQALNERAAFARLRRELWHRAPPAGDLLEIGIGTGASLAHYPPRARVTAIDISENMLERARARAARAGVDVDLRLMDAQHLAFRDASFDAVLATCVFCSVPDPVAGLREARRVLRPGGQLLLLDHVRSDLPVVGRLMDLLNPLVVRATGANINRRTVENVRAAGFERLDVSSHMFGIVKLTEARA